MSVYHMAVDTIFICASEFTSMLHDQHDTMYQWMMFSDIFIDALTPFVHILVSMYGSYSDINVYPVYHYIPVEDLERNNGQDKPYFMSKNLMSLLNVKNKEQTDSTAMRMESVDTIQAWYCYWGV